MEKIQSLRRRIDEVDERILGLLGERVKLCRAIGTVKKEHGIPVKDSLREEGVYNRIREKAAKLGLSPFQVEAVYREIIVVCTGVQESDKERRS